MLRTTNAPVVSEPEAEAEADDVQQTLNRGEFHPGYARYIARPEKAGPMAVDV